MTMTLEEGEGSASRPGGSLHLRKTRYPLYRRLGGPQGRYGQVQKKLPPPRVDPWTAQPVASRYTAYTTWPTGDFTVGCPKMSGTDYHSTLHKISKEPGSYLHHGRNLISHICVVDMVYLYAAPAFEFCCIDILFRCRIIVCCVLTFTLQAIKVL
jgi:hypothetical protein